MDALERDLLLKIADLHGVPEGAYNIRENGKPAGRRSTEHIEIASRKDGKSGIDIFIKPGTKNESVHIPVILSETGYNEVVYNDFYVGEDCDVTIIAGCGIHSCGKATSRHDGVHTFHVGKNSKVRYVERHYGEGDGEKSELTVREKIYTNGVQEASTDFCVDMDGANCKADVVSRSVAADHSKQHFCSAMNGNAACHGHTECDAIIMDGGSVTAAPCLSANDLNAELIHEAAIGKIAGEQLVKLMTLGLTEKEAEEQIIKGFLH